VSWTEWQPCGCNHSNCIGTCAGKSPGKYSRRFNQPGTNEEKKMIIRLSSLALLIAVMGEATIINGVVLCTTNSSCTQLVPKGPTPVNFTGSVSDGGVTLSMTAFADSSFGALRAASSYSLTGPSGAWTQYQGYSETVDTITISSPGLDGQDGYLSASFDVTGTQSVNGLAGLAFFSFSQSGVLQVVGCDPQAPSNTNCFVRGGTRVNFNPLRFTFGQPFTLWTALSASLFMGVNQPLSASADYSQTAVLTQFQPYLDAQLTDAVSDVTFSATSGTRYSVNGVIPEPGSFVLLGIGLAGLGMWRRKRLFLPKTRK
jgi:hypothetical protein